MSDETVGKIKSGAQRTKDSIKQAITSDEGVFGTFNYLKQPAYEIYATIAKFFPPLAWFLVGATALNAAPVALMLGWLGITTLICFAVAGGFIFFVEGFFFLLGSGVILPVIAFAMFSAFVTFLFLAGMYGVFRLMRGALWAIGIIGNGGMIPFGVDEEAEENPAE
ncbi:4134_t:CDS:1 [Ambispora leptoticha]|uniref:4134_t:CDS:1 n=1 Tax=Ambispora leptoticha TaxID=144679 RepID=A0A9N9C793_9GLOM|nr:4134_t:CDS:1 [Ambispora leptoticha]